MPIIPPWENVNPLQFVEAARAGAGLGLQRAQLETQAREAAQRLKQAAAEASSRMGLSYAELGAQEARAGAQLKAAQEREMYDRMMEGQRLDLAQRAQAERESAGQQLTGYRESMLDLREKQLADTASRLAEKAGQPTYHVVGSDLVRIDPSGETSSVFHGQGTGSADKLARALGITSTGTQPTAAPVKSGSEPLPVPKDKAQLKKGQLYNTKRGPARWDGEQFIPEEQSAEMPPEQSAARQLHPTFYAGDYLNSPDELAMAGAGAQ